MPPGVGAGGGTVPLPPGGVTHTSPARVLSSQRPARRERMQAEHYPDMCGVHLRILVALAVVLVAATPVRSSAQQTAAHAVGVGNDVIDIDGRLLEPLRDRASWTGGFVQRDPAEGAPATEPTEFAVAFDAQALIIGARMSSLDAGAVRADVSRRDTESQSESIAISLDT